MTSRLEINLTMRWRRCLAAACLCCVAGCRGSGRVEFASLDFRGIDPPAPRPARLDSHECYWWTDQDGRVWIAMQRQQTAPLNPRLRFEFQLSLVAEKLPAGPALDYKVGRNTLRVRVRFGPWESRFISTAGIVALYREPNDRLRGSVRLRAERLTTRWLGGWGRPTRYLMLGSFVAVHDEQRGRPIAEATESRGWARDRAAAPPRGSAPPPAASRTAGPPATAETQPP